MRQKKLEHRAEKWIPVFGKNDATTKSWSEMPDSEIGRLALVGEAKVPNRKAGQTRLFGLQLDRNDVS
jgi:hypothetical protein